MTGSPPDPVPTPVPVPVPDITVDGTGLLCVALLLRLRAEIAQATPHTVVHVIATDPAAPLDLAARCHMTGHHYLGSRLNDEDRNVYALRVSADARPTHPEAPWHPSQPSVDTQP
ncbi:sulfurtransferase TusA family protein [Streptomyces sp. NPDC048637]|uniref:sulfurtransferase TusA family protein n=1 Tax=Streptomyces sp. NPDC048637 TaxID=3155636 RepID=UPI00342CC0E1